MKKILKAVLSTIVGFVAGAAISSVTAEKAKEREAIRQKSMSDKHLALFMLMNEWVKVKQEGKNLASFLEEKGYMKIAIYGMSYAGETLITELKGTNIEVAYGIDKNVSGLYVGINVVSPDEPLESVDAVVVTAISAFDEIEKMLIAKVGCPIISLEDIVYEM